MINSSASSSELIGKALAFLAGDESALTQFLAITGMDVETLVSEAKNPDFQLGLLEYFIQYEPSLLALAANTGIPPEQIVKTYQALGGRLPE